MLDFRGLLDFAAQKYVHKEVYSLDTKELKELQQCARQDAQDW